MFFPPPPIPPIRWGELWLENERHWSRQVIASNRVDPRLAGINYATNGSPATFYVDLPSAGTYNLALAMGETAITPAPSSVRFSSWMVLRYWLRLPGDQ